MERPEFTSEELFLINYYKARNDKHYGDTIWADAGFIVPSVLIAGWGIYTESALVVSIGFAVLLAFKFREMILAAKWSQSFSNIFQKYDNAFTPPDPAAPAD